MLFDIDGNGSAGAFSDAILILRYMVGLRGMALIGGAVSLDAVRETAADIEAYLGQVIDRFDIDENGTQGAFSDGILIARYLTGLRGEALLSGAVGEDANRRTEAEIVAYLEELATSTLGFVDPEEVRTIEENDALDLQLAIERVSDLSRYSEEELDAIQEWVVRTAPDAPRPDNLISLDFRNAREIGNSPNTFIVELSDDAQTTDAFGELEDRPGIEFAYPLVPREVVLDHIPDDPLFSNQWNLHNTGQTGGTTGVDANLVAAWDIPVPGNPSLTVRGRGVVIGIVDDGLQPDHPDIRNGYRSDLSHDFRDDEPASPNSLNGDHGTAVAGIAAADGDNGIGITGAAPEAEIAGLRLIGVSRFSDAQGSEALSWRNQEIDIYQNSWSPTNQLALEAIEPLTLEALQEGIANGREGKGNIYVFSAGNNREESFLDGFSGRDNVNYNRYANSRRTITTGAIGHNGRRARYSEPGASVMISAPSSSGNVRITTASAVGTGRIENDFRDDFGGTSAAAPLVSGVIALMLEANPELSWRDVQHILVETAVQNDPENSDWVINGAGKHVNHFYGFGLIDAAAAVETAIDWTLVGPERLIAKELAGGLAIPDNDAEGVSTTVTFNSDIQVEWAEVVFQATHPQRGDLEVVLISPDGTESILAEQRPDLNADYDNWIFTSVRHWGEFSSGEWKLRVSDLSSGETGTLDSAELRLYGTGDGVVASANQPPTAVNDVATTEENSPVRIEVLNNDLDPDGDRLDLTGENTISLNGGTIIRDTNGSFDDLSDDSLVYRPAVNFAGTDSFRYTLSDGNGGTDSATVTVTVERPNGSPIAVDDVASTEENTTVRIEVLNNDLDPDDDRLFLTGENTISLNGGTIVRDTNGTFDDLSDDSLVYNPSVNFTGTDSFRYTLSDGNGGTDSATVTVTVERANQAPIAVNDVASIPENSSATIAVLANDLDPDGDPIFVTQVSSPGNGSANISDNQVIYSPAANFFGTDSFTYTIGDGNGGTDSATVTVTVESANVAPIALPDVASTQENSPVNIPVLANDFDLDADAIAISNFPVSTEFGGSVSLNGNALVYTPADGFTGTDSFRYTISDAQDTDTATVTVTVENSAIGDAQIITPVSSTQLASANQAVSIDVQYSTNPANSPTTGMGVRLHWDSTKLSFNSMDRIFADDFLAQGTPSEDTDDLDGDPNTDRFITVSWVDLTGGAWPNDSSSLPISLYRANFTTASDFADSTTVNFTASSTTPGFDFLSSSATLTAGAGFAAMVSIAGSDANASEAGPDTGTFTITRAGDTTEALTVQYTVAGTADGADYTPGLTGTATIAAGESSVEITITPVDNDEVEDPETVELTLVDTDDYDLGAETVATVTIADDDGDAQIITPIPQSQFALASEAVGIDVQYSTNPANLPTTGMGMRLHWDSTKLSFNGLADVLSDDLLADGNQTPDIDDFDNDRTTDRFLLVSWADLTGGSWPNDVSSLPISLYTANFTTASDFADSATVNFSASSISPGFGFRPTSATIGFG